MSLIVTKSLKKPTLFFQRFGTGKDIVLVHGWGTHSGFWKPLLAKIFQYFRITIIDLPGFGRSGYSPSANYDLDYIAEELLSVAPEKAIWLGWSFGGLVATHIASHFPERVEKLVVVASSPKFTRSDDWPGMRNSFIEKLKIALNNNSSDDKLTRILLFQFRNMIAFEQLKDEIKINLFEYDAPNISALRSCLSIMQESDLRDNLAHIECPAYYILGKQDSLVPIAIAEKLNELLNIGNVHILKNACHAPFLSSLDDFVATLLLVAYEKSLNS